MPHVSTDALRRSVTRHLEHVQALQTRGLPPVTCILVRVEGPPPEPGYQPRFSPLPHHGGWPNETVMTDAAFHPSLSVRDPYTYNSHWSTHGGHVTVHCGYPLNFDPFVGADLLDAALSPDARMPLLEAIQVARDLGQRLSPIVRELPPRLAERLGFVRPTPPSDWAEVLFHLGWHFPNHGIEAGRFRILSGTGDGDWDWRCHELDLQLGGVRASPDVFPGVIVSRLGDGSDVLSASACALRLILEALDGSERADRPQPNTEFGRLRDAFRLHAEVDATFPDELSVRLLRLSDSFQTPPATEWAGIVREANGWGLPKYFVLSQLNANRVVCELRGPGSESFQELANRAGALLPCWPDRQPPALLADVASLARRRDPDRYPWAAVAGNGWNSGVVTDHRGNVERWLGFVFGMLLERRLEHLDLMTRPDEITLRGFTPVNATLTLKETNLFAASAWAIETAGLIPAPPETVISANTAATGAGHAPVLAPGVARLLRDALALLDEAAANLDRFNDTARPFADVASEWDQWRTRVAALALTDAEVALRGVIDRSAGAPHRQLPDELAPLWLRLKCWGPGRATDWDEFRSAPHRTDWSGVAAALAVVRQNMRRLFLYLGDERLTEVQGIGATPTGATTEGGKTSNATVNETELAVLNALYEQRPRLLKNVDVEVAANLSKQTVGEAVVSLLGKNLITRPNGRRKGATLTPAGIALVDRIRNSSADHP